MEGIKLNQEPKTVWQVLKALRTVHWETEGSDQSFLDGWVEYEQSSWEVSWWRWHLWVLKNEGVHLMENQEKGSPDEESSLHKAQSSESCYGSNVCVPLPKFICWNLVPKGRIFEWRTIDHHGHEGGALMNGISAPTSHPVRIQQEVGCLQPGRGLSSEPNRDDTLISDFQPLEMWKIHFLYL